MVPTASFTEDLGADSLDTVELIMALEEGFDIEIEDETAADIGTVQDAVNFIEAVETRITQVSIFLSPWSNVLRQRLFEDMHGRGSFIGLEVSRSCWTACPD